MDYYKNGCSTIFDILQAIFSMLNMEIKVKSELITPLTVDTDYEYDLDMTMFPGINDPIARLQPTLLIHTRGGCVCKQDSYADLQELIGSYEIVIQI